MGLISLCYLLLRNLVRNIRNGINRVRGESQGRKNWLRTRRKGGGEVSFVRMSEKRYVVSHFLLLLYETEFSFCCMGPNFRRLFTSPKINLGCTSPKMNLGCKSPKMNLGCTSPKKCFIFVVWLGRFAPFAK